MVGVTGSARDDNHNSFVNDVNGNAARNVTGIVSVSGLLEGVTYDYISVSYPDGVTENYEYYLGGSGGTLEATVILVYQSSEKEFLSTVERL